MEMVLTPINNKPIQDSSLPGGIKSAYEHMDSEKEISPFISPGLNELNRNKAKSSFIEANCESVSISHLRDECITPVFTKCNSVTISHYDFIQAASECVSDFYKGETILSPEIRVSHKILGRIQDALNKPRTELLPHEQTVFWERAAFCIEIPTITMSIGGNTLSLVVGESTIIPQSKSLW